MLQSGHMGYSSKIPVSTTNGGRLCLWKLHSCTLGSQEVRFNKPIAVCNPSTVSSLSNCSAWPSSGWPCCDGFVEAPASKAWLPLPLAEAKEVPGKVGVEGTGAFCEAIGNWVLCLHLLFC